MEDLPWTRRNRSFYYAGAPDPVPPPLDPATTAFLVIDIQNVYLDRLEREFLDDAGRAAWDAWTPFHERMHHIVIPKVQQLLVRFRATGVPCLFARIACLTPEGRDRSLSQKMPGWNNLLLPHRDHASRIPEAIAPMPDEIVVSKTTDSALTGSSLRLILSNMGIRTVICAGIFTDQCISSTVRSLADESFHVVVLEDCCAAGTMDLHRRELEIINMIYCSVMHMDEMLALMAESRG